MKHTKGPWLFCNDGGPDRNIWADTTIVATTEGHWVDCETADYNAYLIAAAPELLKALKMMLECFVITMSLDENDKDTEGYKYRAVKHARAAIAKATGEVNER
jgi:hypothetical protein